jgi:ankyrin repeat protein
VVSLLLDKGANIEALTNLGRTPIFFANEVTLPVLLHRGADVNSRDKRKKSPLHHLRNPECVRLLVDAGADLEARDDEWHTPLVRKLLCNALSVPVLLDRGAKIEVRCGKDRLTPIMLACRYGLIALLERGASLTATDRNGKNALRCAAFFDDREKCQLLILFGADPADEDWEGRSAISHYGCEKQNGNLLTPEQKLERVAELSTPPTLFWACREGFDALVGLLVDRGASLTDVTEEGLNTPCTSRSTGTKKLFGGL